MTSIQEQETTIIIERSQPEAKIYSCDSTFQTKMAKRGHKPYKVEGDGMFWRIPKRLVSIRTIPKPLTEQQQARKAATMRQNLKRLDETRVSGHQTNKEGL